MSEQVSLQDAVIQEARKRIEDRLATIVGCGNGPNCRLCDRQRTLILEDIANLCAEQAQVKQERDSEEPQCPGDGECFSLARELEAAESQLAQVKQERDEVLGDHIAAMAFVREVAELACDDADCGKCLPCRATKWLNTEARPTTAESQLATLTQERDALVQALKALSYAGEAECWCPMAVGNPMVRTHLPSCVGAKAALAGVEGQ